MPSIRRLFLRGAAAPIGTTARSVAPAGAGGHGKPGLRALLLSQVVANGKAGFLIPVFAKALGYPASPLIRDLLSIRYKPAFAYISTNTPGSLYTSALPHSRQDPKKRLLEAYRCCRIGHIVSVSSDEDSRKQGMSDLEALCHAYQIPISRYPFDYNATVGYGRISYEWLQHVTAEITAKLDSSTGVVIQSLTGRNRSALLATLVVSATEGIPVDVAHRRVTRAIDAPPPAGTNVCLDPPIDQFIDGIKTNPHYSVFRRLPAATPGRLYTSAMPCGPSDPQGGLFHEYQRRHIHRVFILATEQELASECTMDIKALYRAAGMVVRHIPIGHQTIHALDSVPSEAMVAIVAAVAGALKAGQHCAIHCKGGVNRSPIVATHVVAHTRGISIDSALEEVRRHQRVVLRAGTPMPAGV